MNAWVVGPTETVDALGRALLTRERDSGRDEVEMIELRFEASPIRRLSSCIPCIVCESGPSDDNRSWFVCGLPDTDDP